MSIQEEGVLADVLEELDRERSKRAELEAQVRQLEQQKRGRSDSTTTDDNDGISRHAYIAMETRLKSMTQVVEALTTPKPAIKAATRRKGGIPLHVIRLLETMPWDAHAQAHIFGYDHVYEWQVWRNERWESNVKFFPVAFKALPVVKPVVGESLLSPSAAVDDNSSENNREHQNLLLFLAGSAVDKKSTVPAKHGVLTDASTTKLYNLAAGYALPRDGGTWTWVGGWRVDKRVIPPRQQGSSFDSNDSSYIEPPLPCDTQGWSYATEPYQFVSHTVMVRAMPETKRFRRRQWTRQRILIDYPQACDRTRAYLSLLAENTRLTFLANKVSDQLVETKFALTESEEAVVQLKLQLAELSSAKKVITTVLQQSTSDSSHISQSKNNNNDDAIDTDKSDAMITQNGGSTTSATTTATTTRNSDGFSTPVRDNISSRLTQWVTSARKSSEEVINFSQHGRLRSNSENVKSLSLDSDQNGSTEQQQNVPIPPMPTSLESSASEGSFEWHKLGRGALIGKLKQRKQAADVPQKDAILSLQEEEDTLPTASDDGDGASRSRAFTE